MGTNSLIEMLYIKALENYVLSFGPNTISQDCRTQVQYKIAILTPSFMQSGLQYRGSIQYLQKYASNCLFVAPAVSPSFANPFSGKIVSLHSEKSGKNNCPRQFDTAHSHKK